MPTFDIVSEIDKIELCNAVDNTIREVGTRFDFRGVVAEIKLDDLTVSLRSESEFQVKQLEDVFRNHCTKRSISMVGVEMDEKPLHSGKTFSQKMTFKQGIDQPKAKEIIRLIKDSKLKVQPSIQGDKIRISGKKRNDLQECIAHLKKAEIDLPLQFENFRD